MNNIIADYKRHLRINGRASCGEFAYIYQISIRILLIVILIGIPIVAVSKALNLSTSFDDFTLLILFVMTILLILAFLPLVICTAIRRLHDRNLSGFWLLGVVVPFVNLFVFVSLLFLQGKSGDNKYGPDPLA